MFGVLDGFQLAYDLCYVSYKISIFSIFTSPQKWESGEMLYSLNRPYIKSLKHGGQYIKYDVWILSV